MISLENFSYEINKHNVQFHLRFKTESALFITKFNNIKDSYILNINSLGIICKLEISKKYWEAFCNNKMYDTIYADKKWLYINLFDKKHYEQFYKSNFENDIIINKSILTYACKVIIYLKIPSNLLVENKLNNPLVRRNTKKLNNSGVTALVISDNRKCTYNEHGLQDILLIVRIAPKSGDIMDSQIWASYCKTCDEYFILKSDYYKLKAQGAILCPIEDRTVKQKGNQKYAYAGSESRIHQLGYNVKKGSKFTSKQRKIILANIVENTGITKAEIKSNIIRCINQHKKHKGYENAISCWQDDLEFINSYHNGDIPKIKVDRLILKYKQDS